MTFQKCNRINEKLDDIFCIFLVVLLELSSLANIATWQLVNGTYLKDYRPCNTISALVIITVKIFWIIVRVNRQQIVFSVRKFLPPQQDLFKKTVSSIAFLNCPWVFYMFSEKIGPANLYLLSPSSLVQFSPDKKSSRHILAREAMKVAGETWQRSRRTSPAAGSYIQPCLRDQPVVQPKCSLILCCGLKEVATKSRVRVYFEQPILALLLVQLVTQQICSCCTTSQWGFLYVVFFAAFTLVWVAGQ